MIMEIRQRLYVVSIFPNWPNSDIIQAREFRAAFSADTSVGYCHVDHGCKIAASGLVSSNGIAKASNDTIYVASTLGAKVTVFERQADNSLLLTDVIPTGKCFRTTRLEWIKH